MKSVSPALVKQIEINNENNWENCRESMILSKRHRELGRKRRRLKSTKFQIGFRKYHLGVRATLPRRTHVRHFVIAAPSVL